MIGVVWSLDLRCVHASRALYLVVDGRFIELYILPLLCCLMFALLLALMRRHVPKNRTQ
jgi:hypothetical protein